MINSSFFDPPATGFVVKEASIYCSPIGALFPVYSKLDSKYSHLEVSEIKIAAKAILWFS